MNQTSCPNCGAGFEPHTRGRLHDKVLHCPYCGHTMDVPDAYEISREEVIRDRPGTVRKVKITERRSDGALGDLPFAESFKGGSFDPKSFFEQLKADGKIPADAEFTSDANGNFEFHTISEDFITHTEKTIGSSVDRLQKIMGKDFDPFGEFSEDIENEPGKMFARTEERQYSRTSPAKSRGKKQQIPIEETSDSTALVKWLVILAVVILMIVLAIKLL